ncbi:MAG: hypothetical protein D4R41_01855 [Sediminibacterium sp.]|nr:MAG: hypothetical protein D4R41_01855 [Sediminibacterium sp.]
MIKFKLDKALPFLNKVAVQGIWRANYPDGNMYYILQDEAEQQLRDGNWSIPEDILKVWSTDDSIVSDALLAAAPWNL